MLRAGAGLGVGGSPWRSLALLGPVSLLLALQKSAASRGSRRLTRRRRACFARALLPRTPWGTALGCAFGPTLSAAGSFVRPGRLSFAAAWAYFWFPILNGTGP